MPAFYRRRFAHARRRGARCNTYKKSGATQAVTSNSMNSMICSSGVSLPLVHDCGYLPVPVLEPT